MEILTIVLLVFIIVCLILIGYISVYNHYQTYIIRINEAETFIDTTLRKRFDLLNKSIGIIKTNLKDKDKEVLKVISDLRSKQINNYELDRLLYDAINEFNEYKEELENLKNSNNFIKIELGLTESEAEIVAARKYYNDIINDYNELRQKFPSNIVGLIARLKPKDYFSVNNKKDIQL